MNKVLSISIAAYNVENVLKQCIDSFLPSKYFDNLEIIIVDDGSKDHTAEIAERYQKDYPESIVFIKKENGGHGSTINAALEKATGKYFKIVDGDDWVDIAALDDLILYLKDNSPDVIINHYNKVYDGAIHPFTVYKNVKEKTIYRLKDLVKGEIPFYPMHSMTVRTELLKESGYKISEHCFYVDNELIFYAMMNCDTLAFLPGHIYQHRLGVAGQSVSPQGLYNHIEDMMHVIDKLFSIYQTQYGSDIKDANSRYLFHQLSGNYAWLFGAYCTIQKDDKDYLLEEFDKHFRVKYAQYLPNLHLRRYCIIPVNYKLILRVFRLLGI